MGRRNRSHSISDCLFMKRFGEKKVSGEKGHPQQRQKGRKEKRQEAEAQIIYLLREKRRGAKPASEKVHG